MFRRTWCVVSWLVSARWCRVPSLLVPVVATLTLQCGGVAAMGAWPPGEREGTGQQHRYQYTHDRGRGRQGGKSKKDTACIHFDCCDIFSSYYLSVVERDGGGSDRRTVYVHLYASWEGAKVIDAHHSSTHTHSSTTLSRLPGEKANKQMTLPCTQPDTHRHTQCIQWMDACSRGRKEIYSSSITMSECHSHKSDRQAAAR